MPAATTFTLTLTANYETIGVKLAYVEAGGWAANSVAVTAQVFHRGLWIDLPDGLKDPSAATYYTKSFGLTEGTTYRIRTIFTRTATSGGEILEALTTTAEATTRSSAVSGNVSTIYISPTGNNVNAGTINSPKKTLANAIIGLPAGSTVLLKNGTYDPTTYSGADAFGGAAWTVSNFDGTSAAVSATIKSETAGGVTITGKRTLAVTSAQWTKHDTRVYWCDFSAYMDTTNKKAPLQIYNPATSRFLYVYRHLNTSSGEWYAIMDPLATFEGFVVDWTNNRLYVRVIGADVAPITNAYQVGWYTTLLTLSLCEYLIIDDIDFEWFGVLQQSGADQYLSSGQSGRPCLYVSTCSNLVVRNCEFDNATFQTIQDCSLITLEDNAFIGLDNWTRFYQSPFDSAYWNRVYTNPSAIYPVTLIPNSGTNEQIVLRRNSFTRCDKVVSGAVASGNNNSDVYENTFDFIFDECVAVDGSGANGGWVNSAIWSNRLSNTIYGIGARPHPNGPLWVINNDGSDNCGFGYMLAVDGGADGDGHMQVYHNTFRATTDYVSGQQSGLAAVKTGTGFGRWVAANNVWETMGWTHFFDLAGAVHTSNSFSTNSIYAKSTAFAKRWLYQETPHLSEALFVTAAGGTFTMSGNDYTTHPYPTGLAGGLNSALPLATTVKGISNLAADALGNRIHAPSLGSFPQLLLDALTSSGTDVIATGRSTFCPGWMAQDHKGNAIYVDGISRGVIYNFKEPAGRQLGIDPPLAAPGIAVAAGGAATAGTYKCSYRYVDKYGTPSAISGLRSIVATANQRFVHFGLLASLQDRIAEPYEGFIELFRSLAADANSQFPVPGTGYAATLHATTATANDGGYVKFTATAAHGFLVGDIVVIAGQSTSEYNTVGEVIRVASTTTFTLNIGFLTGTGSTGGTATQRIFSFGHTGTVTANASNGGKAQFTTSKPHHLAVGCAVDIAGSGISAYDNATTSNANTTPIVISIQSVTQFTTNLIFSAGTPAGGATIKMVGFGLTTAAGGDGVTTHADAIGATGDMLADTTLDDNAGWTITSPSGAFGSTVGTGYEGTIRRFVPPPNYYSVVVTYQQRLYYCVVVKYTKGTVTTNGTNLLVGVGTDWTAEMVDRWVWIEGEDLPYIITAFEDSTHVRLNKVTVTSASSLTYSIKPDPATWRQARYTEQLESESCAETNTVTVQQADEDHDEMTGAAQHGTSLYFLFERHLFKHTFSEQPKIDGATVPVARRGCINQRCWTTFEGQLYLLDQFGPWRFGAAGSGTDDIGLNIQDMIRDGEIDWDKKCWFSVGVDPEQRLVIYCVALKGDSETRPLRQFAYDIRTGQWSPYVTAQAIGGVCHVSILGRQRTIFGAQDDVLYVTNSGLGDSAKGAVGLATSATSTTLTDSTAAFATNEFTDWAVEIVAGTGSGQKRTIASNTATALTVSTAFTTTPDSTSRYAVYHDGLIKTATTGGTTTSIPISGTPWIADQWVGASVAFLSGTLRGEMPRRVVSNTTGALTVSPTLPSAIASGDQFVIGGIPWSGKTGLLAYVTENDMADGKLDNRRGLLLTFEPTIATGQIGVRVFKNHETTPVANAISNVGAFGITATKDGTEVLKDIKRTRNTEAPASGLVCFEEGKGGVDSRSQEAGWWVAYEVRGVQSQDRVIIHQMEVLGVK